MRRIQPNDTTDLIGSDAVAIEQIQNMGKVASQRPRLQPQIKTEHCEGSSYTRRERDRRNAELRLYRKLSRYYPRMRGEWTYTELLAKCKHGRIR